MSNLTPTTLPAYLVKYHSKSAITSSSLRGQCKKGGVKKCREYCNDIDHQQFIAALKGDYKTYLDNITVELKNHAKSVGLKWGSARKVLNIFFRKLSTDAFLMNGKLPNELLNKLEVPLDGMVGKGLIGDTKTKNLKWTNIRDLKRKKSDEFQALARQVAKKNNVPAVFLDFDYWTR